MIQALILTSVVKIYSTDVKTAFCFQLSPTTPQKSEKYVVWRACTQ